APLHHVAPPLALDVFFEFHSQRPVVPCGTGSAVDLTGGEDESPSFGQRHNGVNPRGRTGHGTSLLFLKSLVFRKNERNSISLAPGYRWLWKNSQSPSEFDNHSQLGSN